MRAGKSGRVSRRLMGAALAVALLTSMAIGVAVTAGGGDANRPRAANAPKAAPIDAILTAFNGVSDFFLQSSGLPGEVQDPATHSGEIELNTVAWGLVNPVSSSGTGRATWDEIQITKRIDRSSPLLMTAVARGTRYSSMVLTGIKSGGDGPPIDYFQLTLFDVHVTSFKEVGDLDHDHVSDSFSLHFSKLRFRYLRPDPDTGELTPVQTCWDIANNRAC